MTITYHRDLIQGTEEWFAARCGLLTASEMDKIITPKKLEPVSKKDPNDMIAHGWELMAQRISGYVEPDYISNDMIRGHEDEEEVRKIYAKEVAPVEQVGFITNDRWGFTLGYSPDGLVGDDGLIEGKSRDQKFQIETITKGGLPDDFRIQIQTGLLVSERKWLDFCSYSGGLLMPVMRVYPDLQVQDAILKAAQSFEDKMKVMRARYEQQVASGMKLIPTVRIIRSESLMMVGETT